MSARAWTRTGAAIFLMAAAATAANAEQVTLVSYDGAVTLTGDLLEFDGSTYRVDTTIGEINIDAMQVSCEGPGCPDPSLLRSEFALKGSRTVGETLMPAIVTGYAEALEADVIQTESENGMTISLRSTQGVDLATVALQPESTAAAFDALLENSAAYGMAARRITPAEAQRFAAAGLGDMTGDEREKVVALDGLVVIVSPTNPIDTLSTEEIAGIFSGRITNWSEVGGEEGPITVYARDPEAGSTGVFRDLVLNPYRGSISPEAEVYESDEALADDVAFDPGGIGFTTFASVRSAKPVGLRSECGLVATPDAFSVKTEEYPLARRLFLYRTDAPRPPHAQKLLDFALSNEAQQIIADTGFVDQAVSLRPINEQGLRFALAFTDPGGDFDFAAMRALARQLIAAKRLSTTFRFNPGSAILDSKAVRDLDRVIDFLTRTELRDKEVLLIGFTDSIGKFDLNQALSFRRAGQVFRALQEKAPPGALTGVDIKVMGFGELAPVGCNTDLNGQRINRRVEVWVRDKV